MQVFCGGDFTFLRKLTEYIPLARPVTVLDAGANVGLATLLLTAAIRFNGQVVAVDANPDTMKVSTCLHHILSAWGLMPDCCSLRIQHSCAYGADTFNFGIGGGARGPCRVCSRMLGSLSRTLISRVVSVAAESSSCCVSILHFLVPDLALD